MIIGPNINLKRKKNITNESSMYIMYVYGRSRDPDQSEKLIS